MKYSALLFGDYTDAPYHPLSGIDDMVGDILEVEFEVSSTGDYNFLSKDLSQFQLVISYADQWGSTLEDSQIGNLISFVAKGGGLLVIHNGISLASRHEFKSMTGAWFTGHPEAETLPFRVESEDPIVKGVENFELFEEPYQYGFCNHVEKAVFLTYQYRGKVWESGWTTRFGAGKVVCLHPGHDIKAFNNDAYRKIIHQSALWCVEARCK